MDEYTIQRIPMGAFYIEEGMYTIEELEQMLAEFKEAKAIQDKHLEAAIRPIKEKNA